MMKGGMAGLMKQAQQMQEKMAKMQEDKEVLEDLIAAAINDAVRKLEQTNQEKMAGFTGGMNLPDGFKMPF